MTMTAPMTALDLPMQGRATRLARIMTVAGNLVRALRHRRAATRLVDLDDALLMDIGLTRAELNGIMRNTRFDEDPTRLLSDAARRRARALPSFL